MAAVPKARFSPSPLIALAASLSLGILAGHYFGSTPSSLAIANGAGALFMLLAVWFAATKRLPAALGMLGAAFVCAGLVLSLIDGRPPGTKRIARLYDDRVIASEDPVELTGVVEGEPEPAPDTFYLTLRAERIGFKGSERDASGTVLLLAHARGPDASEYAALELRHGARVRVMTALDREESFRNPGAPSFTEYLERKGYYATEK